MTVLVEVTVERAVFVGVTDFVDVIVAVTVFVGTDDFVDVLVAREVGVGRPDLVAVTLLRADLEGADDFVADLEVVEVLVGNKLIFSRYLREEDESKQNVSVRHNLVSVFTSSGYTSL